jgi:PAS domain S-box-containing protein
VDDEPAGRETLESLLLAHDYHLAFASDGPQALQQADALLPDLILLDVMMPGMDGFAVCRRLRETPHLAEIPVVMVTALDDRDSRLEGIAAGADDFISKPFDRAELRLRIATITRLNRYRRLMQERARFEQLIELAPDGFLIVDQEGTICLANPSVLRMLGVQHEKEVLGKHLHLFLPPQQHSLCMTCMQSILLHPSTVMCVDVGLLASNGAGRPVEMHAGYVLWQDAPAVQMIVRDITERKQAEEEHVQMVQKLAERERRLQYLVEKLISSQEEERRRVAYELHDGLAQVASSTHQQLQTFSSLYYPEDAQAAAKLDHVLQLAHQVVREARQVIAGMRPTVLDDFGLASALRMEVETLRSEGYEVMYEESTYAERLPASIETAFYRVAQEALNNIRKHAQTKRVRMGVQCDAQSIRMEVQDWGCGFDGAKQETSSAQGEHIGLPGMEERMKLLDGRLRVLSQPGQGTLIVAEAPLPLADEEAAAVADDDAEYRQPRSSVTAQLVIADDHDLSRAGVRSMLEGEQDVQLVGEATNGREALELCQKLRPDMALLDVRMPEMDGLQATRAIKNVCPETSVIIVTMHENAEYLLAAMRAGASGYLLKDTSRREFLAAIRQVLRGESFLNTELTHRLLTHLSQEEPSQPVAQPLAEPLTARELEVLQLLAQGKTNRQIAADLIISHLTVKVHVQRIIAKLEVSDRTHAAVRAIELGLLER